MNPSNRKAMFAKVLPKKYKVTVSKWGDAYEVKVNGKDTGEFYTGSGAEYEAEKLRKNWQSEKRLLSKKQLL